MCDKLHVLSNEESEKLLKAMTNKLSVVQLALCRRLGRADEEFELLLRY
jgi:hypothetical protein